MDVIFIDQIIRNLVLGTSLEMFKLKHFNWKFSRENVALTTSLFCCYVIVNIYIIIRVSKEIPVPVKLDLRLQKKNILLSSLLKSYKFIYKLKTKILKSHSQS